MTIGSIQPGTPATGEWTGSTAETALDPDQRIIDAHHHLYERPGVRYLLEDLLRDLSAGHDVVATVLVQARFMYRSDGPESLKPVGETEFANSVAVRCASRPGAAPLVCAGIVGYADLCLGDAVRPVLEAHKTAGDGRFRGVRHIACWDRDHELVNPAYPATEDMLDSAAFREGFRHLEQQGLSFDAWLYFHQIPRLTALARAFPTTRIVLNHCGGIIGIRGYAGRRDEVFSTWTTAMRELATCANVSVKLGGLGMPLSGFGFEASGKPPSSSALAAAWKPWMEFVIETFGAARCMFESNFPADKASHGYANGWNAMKRIAAFASAEEKADLFWRSAARSYQLPGFAVKKRGTPSQSSDLSRSSPL